MKQDCVFCKILHSELSGSFVYRDNDISAFLDIHPINSGHTLIVPNIHYDFFEQIPSETFSKMANLAQNIQKIFVEAGVQSEGSNIFLSNGKTAGQEVLHAHLHITPRFSGDGHRMGFLSAESFSEATRAQLDEISKNMTQALKNNGCASLSIAKATEVYCKSSSSKINPSIFDPIHINTEHVKIRPLKAVSWQILVEGLLYENSFHALNWGIRTPEDIKKMYERNLLAFQDQKMNPIVFLNQDESIVLGITSFRNIEITNKTLEIGGTWINKKYQRSFVNTETKFALLKYIFEELKFNRVEFHIDAENLVSQKAVQRLGFDYDGFLPQRKINGNGEARDYVFYSVTHQNWPYVKSCIQDLIDKSKLPEFESISKIKNLLKQNLVNEAFSDIQQSIFEYPKSASLHYLAACICDAHRTETEAVRFYLKSLDLGIAGLDRRDALLGLGSTYRSLGKYEESKKYFEIGIKEFPDYRPYKVFLALTEFNLKQADVSVKYLLEQLIETTADQEIRSYQKALKFYSTRLSEVFE